MRQGFSAITGARDEVDYRNTSNRYNDNKHDVRRLLEKKTFPLQTQKAFKKHN